MCKLEVYKPGVKNGHMGEVRNCYNIWTLKYYDLCEKNHYNQFSLLLNGQ